MGQRQITIDYLRGIAALLVCGCHFRYALPSLFDRPLEIYGALGVQIFFVISGYIIPFAMARSNYELSSFHRFLGKRLVRLHPPLVVAVLVTFTLSFLAAHAKHEPPLFAWSDLLPSLFYLNIPAENPVIWSLVVELKYYVLIALLFPLLFSKISAIRRLSFLGLAASSALAPELVLPLKFMPYFLIGFAVCYHSLKYASHLECSLLIAVALAAAVPGSTLAQVLAGLFASLFIVFFPKVDWKIGAFYGGISYSLYLIHFPLGVKFLNLALPHVSRL
jgi:peptidoglycan/LPS O-acetylase OafA/YrhL